MTNNPSIPFDMQAWRKRVISKEAADASKAFFSAIASEENPKNPNSLEIPSTFTTPEHQEEPTQMARTIPPGIEGRSEALRLVQEIRQEYFPSTNKPLPVTSPEIEVNITGIIERALADRQRLTKMLITNLLTTGSIWGNSHE